LAGACKLQQETLAIKRRVQGNERPKTLASMSNLAENLRAQRDLAGARKLQEELLTICRRVLGAEHQHTTISAWNLYRTVKDLGEQSAARAVLECNLKWLLVRDPATLDTQQRKTRNHAAEAIMRSNSG